MQVELHGTEENATHDDIRQLKAHFLPSVEKFDGTRARVFDIVRIFGVFANAFKITVYFH